MKTVIYSHNRGNGIRALREALNTQLRRHIPVIGAETNALTGHNTINLINWGSSSFPQPNNWTLDNPVRRFNILNSALAVKNASDKLRTFRAFSENNVNAPAWTDDPDLALRWLQDEGKTLVARTVLRGSGGEGIVILEPNTGDFTEAPVYTQYMKKKYEYRVHIFNGQVIDVQQKRHRRNGDEVGARSKIRNLANGWVFCRDDLQIDTDVNRLYNIAKDAVDALGLDFGAVDIIYNSHYDAYCALEVNTAPGLEGTTVTKYAEAITAWIRQQGQL